MTWIVHPLTQCVLVVLAVGFTLDLMRTVKVRVRSTLPGSVPLLAAEIEELKRRLGELAERERNSEAHIEPAATPAGEPCALPGGYAEVRPGMNLSRRSQALRLYRRGETPEQIASSLRVPTGEVRLLLKVHRMGMERVFGSGGDLKSATESTDKRSSARSASRHG